MNGKNQINQEKLTASAELFQNSVTFRYSGIRLLNKIFVLYASTGLEGLDMLYSN